MEKVIECKENEVLMEFELGCRCISKIHLSNPISSLPVGFKIQTNSPHHFLVDPPHGFLHPLQQIVVDIILKPHTELPDHFPRSKHRFSIQSAVAPHSAASWSEFESKQQNMFVEAANLKVVYTGGLLLRHLVARGELSSVKFIIRRQSCCNRRDQNGRTALHIAAAAGDLKMLNLLLNKGGARVDLMSKSGNTPLLEAAYTGHTHILQALLSKGASTEAKNPQGWTALHLAASLNHLEVIQLLLENNANIEARDCQGRTPLHSAVTDSQIECVKLLLEAGADKDAQSYDGRSALYRAAANGYAEIADVLLDYGANPKVATCSGQSPYDIAKEKDNSAVMQVVEYKDGLLTAARTGDVELVEEYISKGANVKVSDEWGWTALHRAAFTGNLQIICKLIQAGAYLEERDVDGHTPLHCAVQAGHVAAVDKLISFGANPDLLTAAGLSAFAIASQFHHNNLLLR